RDVEPEDAHGVAQSSACGSRFSGRTSRRRYWRRGRRSSTPTSGTDSEGTPGTDSGSGVATSVTGSGAAGISNRVASGTLTRRRARKSLACLLVMVTGSPTEYSLVPYFSGFLIT